VLRAAGELGVIFFCLSMPSYTLEELSNPNLNWVTIAAGELGTELFLREPFSLSLVFIPRQLVISTSHTFFLLLFSTQKTSSGHFLF
jgi:hypothetical protein